MMDAFVLAALISELRPELLGKAVVKVSQPSSSSLLLQFRGPEGTDYLLLSADPSFARLHLVTAPPPSIPLTPFGGLIEQEGLERVVAFDFQDATLYVEIIGKDSNLILTDGSGQVLHALRRRPGLGETYTPPPKPKKRDPLTVTFEEFQQLFPLQLDAELHPTSNIQHLTSSKEPWKALVDTFFGLSPLIAKEVAFRAAQHPSPFPSPQRGEGWGEGRIEGLWQALQEVLARVREARFKPRLLLDEKGYPFALAAFPFRSFPEDRQIPYSRMSEAAERFYALKAAEEELAFLKRGLARRLTFFEKRLPRRKVKLEEVLLSYEKAETYKTMGRLLLAHKGHIRKGESVIELPNYTGGIVTIPLDPALSIQLNAERYFRLYKKAKKGEAIARKRLNEAEAELHRLALLRKRLEEASDREAISALERELPTAHDVRRSMFDVRPSSIDHRASRPGVRRFRSSDGFEILVGKSGPSNEYLTWKLAKPHDLWLHAHGVSGSHVVVRLLLPPSPLRGRVGVPPKTLEEAAKLAAYYSKARNQGKVEVAYTLRKHLKKPKRGKGGTVLLMHEKTILVEPDPTLVKKLAHPHPSPPPSWGRAGVGD